MWSVALFFSFFFLYFFVCKPIPPPPPQQTIRCVGFGYLEELVIFSLVVWQENGVAKCECDLAYVQEFIQVPFLAFILGHTQRKRIGNLDPARVTLRVMMCVYAKFYVFRSTIYLSSVFNTLVSHAHMKCE